jgi:hypothetical protein
VALIRAFIAFIAVGAVIIVVAVVVITGIRELPVTVRAARIRFGFGFGIRFRSGFEAVPGAALVDAVDQDHRADLVQGPGQARPAEPHRLGVDRCLAGQRVRGVKLAAGQRRRARVLAAQLDPPVPLRRVLARLDALRIQPGLEPGSLLLQVRDPMSPAAIPASVDGSRVTMFRAMPMRNAAL